MLALNRSIPIAVSIAWGMCVTGCSHGTSGHSAGTASRGARGVNQPAMPGGGSTARADEVFGYTAPADPRFDVSLDDIRGHVRNNSAAFIDARSSSDFALGHVRGAMNVVPSQKEKYLPQISQGVPKEHLVIIYCNGPHCDSAEMVSDYLTSQGYTNTRVYKPGWKSLGTANDIRSR